jgi:hypothetical protein
MREDELEKRIYHLIQRRHTFIDTARDIIYLFKDIGWSPPVPTRLKAVEKCPALHWSTHKHPVHCECHGTGTITRTLTQEELVEVAERAYEIPSRWRKDGVIILPSPLT